MPIEKVSPQVNNETLPTNTASSEVDLGALVNPRSAPRNGVIFGAVLMAISGLSTVALMIAYVTPMVESVSEAQVANAATPIDPFAGITLKAKSAYVLDIATGEELFASHPTVQLPLASITKVALVLAAAEVLEPEHVLMISREAVQRSEGGLTMGEKWRVKDLIDYTLLTSSNTAAEALSEAADPAFAEAYPQAEFGAHTVARMNALASQLGMRETFFLNASGLDISDQQAGALSSAKDVAKLFAHAYISNRELFAATTRATLFTGPINGAAKTVINTNEALGSIPSLIIGKTGTTALAGGNLAIVFEPSPNRPIAIVVLGSSAEGRFEDIKVLVEAASKTVIPVK